MLAALLYFVLSQFVDKKIILLANVTGNVMMHLYLMAVCSLPSIHPPGKILIHIRCDQVYLYNTVDPRWMWLAGMFSFIGGGDLILNALLQALVAETIPNHSL